MKIANTQTQMYELAKEHGEAMTRKGGWVLKVSLHTTYFQLTRYQHHMLHGFLDCHTVILTYTKMLRTDVAGVNKFLEHFEFAGRVGGNPTTYVVPILTTEGGQRRD